MDDHRYRNEAAPDEFINTATGPRWFGTVAAIVFIGLSLLAIGWLATHPILGIGLGHPVTITAGVLIVLSGLWLIVHVWRQSDEAWRKVPDGPLSPEVRTLADSGQTEAAIKQLTAETGAGVCEAWQVINKYLAVRERSSA